MLFATVEYQHKSRVAPFLFATGSPYTYLTASAFRDLGIEGEIPTFTQVLINGKPVEAKLSIGPYTNINILGYDFVLGLNTLIEPGRKTFTFTKPSAACCCFCGWSRLVWLTCASVGYVENPARAFASHCKNLCSTSDQVRSTRSPPVT